MAYECKKECLSDIEKGMTGKEDSGSPTMVDFLSLVSGGKSTEQKLWTWQNTSDDTKLARKSTKTNIKG